MDHFDENTMKALTTKVKDVAKRHADDPQRYTRLGWNDIGQLYHAYRQALPGLPSKLRYFLKEDATTSLAPVWKDRLAELTDVEHVLNLSKDEATQYVKDRLLALMRVPNLLDKPSGNRRRSSRNRNRGRGRRPSGRLNLASV